MNELHKFIEKCTAKTSGISCRKLYGLDAFYLSDRPFIVITSNEHIAVKVDDFEVIKKLKTHQIIEWSLNGKIMDNWFILPESFNKKKNKLVPVLEMTSKALLHPKKEKKKRVYKEKSIKKTEPTVVEVKKSSFFKRLFQK